MEIAYTIGGYLHIHFNQGENKINIVGIIYFACGRRCIFSVDDNLKRL